MNLKIFFSAIGEEVTADIHDLNSFYHSIRSFTDIQPEIDGARLAILGVSDHTKQSEEEAVLAADEVRKKLYQLKKGSGQYRIVDLGNLRKGIDVHESHLRLKEVCAYLIEQEVLPVIIGTNHDYTYGQYLAYEHLDKLVSFLNVDAFLDMEDEGKQVTGSNHLHHLLMHEPNYLFSLSHLGYQSYLVDQKTVEVLEKLYFDLFRLGSVRQSLQDMEPIIRDADFMSFDIAALKSSDAPGCLKPQPFGLTGEEACQISWYAGLNEKMSSAGFYGYDPENDDKDQKTASVMATMIWYFIEGYQHRKEESNFRGNDYVRYVVSMPSEPESLVFYKSKFSEKWWIEVPYPKTNFGYDRNLVVSCSYKDFQTAQKGEVPERWVIMQNKLI